MYVDDNTQGVTSNNDNLGYVQLSQDLLHTLNHIYNNDTSNINTTSVPVVHLEVSIGDSPFQVVQSTKLLWVYNQQAYMKLLHHSTYHIRPLQTLPPTEDQDPLVPRLELGSVNTTFIIL